MVLIYLIFSVIYAVAGYACFVTFLVLNSYTTAVWGLITGAVSSVGAHVCVLVYKNRLGDWYEDNDLKKIYSLGFSAFAFGTSGLVYHIVYYTLSICYKRPVDVYTLLPVVWTFMTLKSGIMLMFFVDKIRNRLHNESEA